MKLGIMQPYFLPYIGYFQLINATDTFVIYDNIKYTKRGWINRNRILAHGKDEYVTLPLERASDSLHINQRFLSDSFDTEKKKILRKVSDYYRKAPYFNESFMIFEEILEFDNKNLFDFIHNSLVLVCKFLDISREFIISSTLPIDHNLTAEDKVLAICKNMRANCYINPIGGVKLYSKERFAENKIALYFLNTRSIVYPQLNTAFIPNLSILDIMMFNSKDRITYFLNNEYTLID